MVKSPLARKITDANLISLNPTSGVPIYRQLVDQIQRLVANGTLASGESLPSVRKLAQALSINPMTISKAYSILEQSKVVVRQHGVGMIVNATNLSPADVLSPQLHQLTSVAHELDLELDEVIKLVKLHWKQ